MRVIIEGGVKIVETAAAAGAVHGDAQGCRGEDHSQVHVGSALAQSERIAATR